MAKIATPAADKATRTAKSTTGKATKPAKSEEKENNNPMTLAVDRDIAAQVKAIAKELDTTTLDATNQLLRFALSQGAVEMTVTKMIVSPKDIVEAAARKRDK
jgi:hypothetical protein